MKSPVAPWIALITGPLLCLINQLINFVAVPWVCATQNYWLLHLTHALAFGLVVWAGFLSHRVWRDTGGGVSSEGPEVKARDHFLGLIAIMTSAFSAALVLAMWLPNFMLGACQ